MLNGLTHYFNLLTNKINDQPGVEIIFVCPLARSSAMGEGVFETRQGANFEIIELEEKWNSGLNTLYYVGLDGLLKERKPDIIMLAETHMKSFMFDGDLKKIIKDQNIRIVLKSIPFRVRKYEEALEEIKNSFKKIPVPPFSSIPSLPRKILLFLRINFLYKKFILDKPKVKKLVAQLNFQKRVLNFPDAHVNYVEEAYKILGSYDVPKRKIFITYNSPDTDLYFLAKSKIKNEPAILPFNEFRIIHLSRLAEWKRVDMLITATASLKKTYPKIELLVLGDGPAKKSLINQTIELGVEDSVNFLGAVYDVELIGKYLRSSSIYVLAGMGGLSINDAMIFGLPIICSVCDGTEKHLVIDGYNGIYFEEGNQQSLETKISHLFNNPELRIKMGENSLKIIQNQINIHTVVEGYMKAFKYVCSNKESN